MDSKSFKSGIILGTILLILGISTLTYFAEFATSLFEITAISICFVFLFPFILALSFIHDLRKVIGGYWNFSKAARCIFIMLFIAETISFTGKNIIYAKFLNPQVEYKVQKSITDATSAFMSQSGIDPKIAAGEMDKIRNRLDPKISLSLANNAITFLEYIFYLLIASIILATIYQKKQFTVETNKF
jgi:hypothetical protein